MAFVISNSQTTLFYVQLFKALYSSLLLLLLLLLCVYYIYLKRVLMLLTEFVYCAAARLHNNTL